MDLKDIFIVHPSSIQEASDFLRNKEVSYPLAGGSEVILLMEKGVISDCTLVDITRLGLKYIILDGDYIKIGATTPIHDLIHSKLLEVCTPSLVQAARELGSLQIRTSATIGGNLCAAVPCADTAVPLLTLNALVRIVNSNQEYMVPLTHFFLAPRKTVLIKGDIVTEILIPKPEQGETGKFSKIGRRKTLTLATASVAVQLSLDNNNCFKTFRVAFGAVAPTPIRALSTEKFLIGKLANPENIEKASFLISETIKPITDIRASKEYRMQISKVIFKRVTNEILGLKA